MSNDQSSKQDVYSIVTDRIIAQLEQKIIPWRRPWTDAGIPRNLITKNAYRGINTWMLASMGYEKNFFLTYKQVQELKGTVKRGEKSHMVVFWKVVPKEESVATVSSNSEQQDTSKKKVLLRYYSVFNVSQCEGLPEGIIPSEIERPNAPIAACEAIVSAMPLLPKIQHKEQSAWYSLRLDMVNMPKRKSFVDSEAYYSTLFHELVHSTGHETRLKRKEIIEKPIFGSSTYSIEELCAEIGACYLKSIAGVSDKGFEANVSYIDGWLTELKKDKRFIFYASSNAQKAVDFILNKKVEEKEEEHNSEPAELETVHA